MRHRRPIARPRVEGLESRRLLTAITEFPIPTAQSTPLGITSGPDGNLWFVETGHGNIAEINPTTHAIAEFPLPTTNRGPVEITTGADGNLWFTENGNNAIGEINPTTHAIAEFPLPAFEASPQGITSGPDGNLWFTEDQSNNIGEINPTTHAIAEFPIPTASCGPLEITTGPDGNLWFTEQFGDKIGQINPTTHAIAEFPLPSGGVEPTGITAGPDGNLWFTVSSILGGNDIGQINPTTHAIVEFPLPTDGSRPSGITTGPDGNLWFTEIGRDAIGNINSTTHAISDTLTPTAGSVPQRITLGPDGNLWFTEEVGNSIGQAVPSTPPTAPDLALSGTAPDSVMLGSEVTYGLKVNNGGEADATGVTLTDTLPAGVTFVSATGGVTPVDGVLTFSIGDLAAGASTSVSIVVTPTAAGTLSDSAVASMGQADPTPDDNSVNLSTTVSAVSGRPDLVLSGNAPDSVTAGSNVTYNLTVTNDGTADCPGFSLADTLPTGVAFVSATNGVTPVDGELVFAFGILAAGASTSVTIVVTPTAAGMLSDTADAAMDQDDPTPNDNSLTLNTTVTSPAGTADLSISGNAPDSVTVGGSVTYRLTVTNDGTADATGVTLTDTLPAGVTFASASGGVTPVDGVLTFTIGDLAAGASTNVSVVVTPTATGALSDTATASMDQTDPTPDDNSLSLPTRVTAVVGTADLTLSAGAPDSVTLGNNLTYTLTVTNGGPSAATGVILTDTLPPGVTFVSATSGVMPVDGVLTFALGGLAAGSVTSVTIVVTPTAAGTLSGGATVRLDQHDPTPDDDSVTLLATVAAPAAAAPAAAAPVAAADQPTVAPTVAVDGPRVTLVQRFGFHQRPTRLVLTFDRPLDPARAQDLTNHHLLALDGARGTIGIKSAVYDPATRTLTLRPVHRLRLFDHFRLTVVGTGSRGLTDTSGNLLDGQRSGRPGSDFVTVISAASLVLTPAEQRKPCLRQDIKALSVSHPGLDHLLPVTASQHKH